MNPNIKFRKVLFAQGSYRYKNLSRSDNDLEIIWKANVVEMHKSYEFKVIKFLFLKQKHLPKRLILQRNAKKEIAENFVYGDIREFSKLFGIFSFKESYSVRDYCLKFLNLRMIFVERGDFLKDFGVLFCI